MPSRMSLKPGFRRGEYVIVTTQLYEGSATLGSIVTSERSVTHRLQRRRHVPKGPSCASPLPPFFSFLQLPFRQPLTPPPSTTSPSPTVCIPSPFRSRPALYTSTAVTQTFFCDQRHSCHLRRSPRDRRILRLLHRGRRRRIPRRILRPTARRPILHRRRTFRCQDQGESRSRSLDPANSKSPSINSESVVAL